MSISDRANHIIATAKQLIAETDELSDQDIDREFIFRYEYGWQLRANKIRELINEIAGNDISFILLPEDQRPKMWVFLEFTKGLADRPETSDTGRNHTDPPFGPFDERLRSQYEAAISAGISGNPSYIREIQGRIEEERQRARYLQDEILRVARQYAIVPLGNDQWNRFPMDQIELQLVNLRNCFLFDFPTPKFLFPIVRYLESPTETPITRWLRPSGVLGGDAISRSEPSLRPRTRVRTWSVYFVSRRGGGSHTEAQAVDIWNESMMDTLAPRNYREDRYRLLESHSFGESG